ncbi:UNVERIFIED_CONTAM: hypothetical protein GTU68_013888 [Idotea baltica]|nr:hypothetical protein [Idotea baltica]
MKMGWHDLLFMHYRVSVSQLRSLIPAGLEMDTYDGSAWIGIVPFRMTGVSPRLVPPLPGISKFPELNVRTYVTIDGKPGVWFFSLDATSWLAVRSARRFFHLNYVDANINFRGNEQSGDGTWFGYESTRTHKDAPPAKLKCEYRPIGAKYQAAPNTLEHFLTARYCLYSASPKGKIYRGEIDHLPWELSDAQVLVSENTMLDGLGIDTRDQQPVLHFAGQTQAKAWLLTPVT